MRGLALWMGDRLARSTRDLLNAMSQQPPLDTAWLLSTN